MPLLEYKHVSISYDGVEAVHDVSCAVDAGEICCLVGESGSGKSTLAHAALGQLGDTGQLTSGEILFDGKSILGMSQSELRGMRGSQMAIVFQDCLAHLTPIRKIGDQIFESRRAHRNITRQQSDEEAIELLAKLGLENPQGVLASYPFNLSGGMGQRVGIAIALLAGPQIILADEPTSALDVISQAQVVDLFSKVRDVAGCGILFITHNISIAQTLADTVCVMKAGEIIEQGSAKEVLERPSQDYTRALIESLPRLKRK